MGKTKYYRLRKEKDAVYEEIDSKEAFRILSNNYREDGIKEMLLHEQIIPCMFCYIKVVKGV